MRSYMWIAVMAAAMLVLGSVANAQPFGGNGRYGARHLADPNSTPGRGQLADSNSAMGGRRLTDANGLPGGIHRADANSARSAQANEQHREMQTALYHLQESKRELEKSGLDYAGHRRAALDNTETAMRKVEEGLRGEGAALSPSAFTAADVNGTPGVANDRHKEMRLANFHLREAMRELERSGHDYHGSRLEALKHAEHALQDVDEGLRGEVLSQEQGQGHAQAQTRPAHAAHDATSRPAIVIQADPREQHKAEMRRALSLMTEARRELARSTVDTDGHRMAALRDAEHAIKELSDALNGETVETAGAWR